MVNEFLLGKAFDEIYSFIKTVDRRIKKKFLTNKKDFENSINIHLKDVSNWSSEISFRDLQKSKKTRDLFINLNFYVTPKSTQLIKDETVVPLNNLMENIETNLIILGKPGAGKTTSMKFISNKLLTDEFYLKNKFNFPIVIRLRELKINRSDFESKEVDVIESLYYKIYAILGLRIEINSVNENYLIDDTNYRSKINIIKNVVAQALDELGVLLILDGWDEIATLHKDILIQEIRFFSLNLNQSKLIITSRTNEFNYDLDNSQTYEICELNDSQIKHFIQKWILQDESSNNLYKQIIRSPFKDTLAKPLTLAHLCAIYERYGRIPEKPKTLYNKIITLLLEEWDTQRSVIRKSNYSNFETDRKFDFLSNLSFYLTSEVQKVTFSKQEFENAYKEICVNFNLPIEENKQVAKELESHTGLFIQSGYDKYEFAHKSLQEYLSAEYLVRLPQIPFNPYILAKLPNELALAISISSNPTNYFSGLILVNVNISKGINYVFANKLLNRLYLEKPDFIVHPILAVAFLSLYEKCYTKIDNHDVFELFFNIKNVKLSLEKLNQYYEIESNSDSSKDLIKLKLTSSFNNDVIYSVPKELLSNKKFHK
jgi:predicted NACHT family NTPase